MDAPRAQVILGDLLRHLGFPAGEIKATMEDSMLRLDIVVPEPRRLIGWHGETLNAIQHLVKAIMRTKEGLDRAPFILLDVDGYRRLQEDKVRKIAEQKSELVRRTGNRIALAPMSPYFRRIVHLHIANTPTLSDITTESIGEGEYRQVVLRSKNEDRHASGEELSPVISGDDGLENLDI